MKVYKIECEWDIGLDNLYKSETLAMKALKACDWSNLLENDESIDDLIEEGLICIIPINVIEK